MCAKFLCYSIFNSTCAHSGNITIPDGMTFTLDSGLNGDSPQFTLTCISTGGPATTVTWTRDSETVSEGNMTMLDDSETAQYTHNLTVSGRLGGLYQCTVSNNKPSSASAQFNVQGKFKKKHACTCKIKNINIFILQGMLASMIAYSLPPCPPNYV